MNNFLEQINAILDIDTLQSMKERIKSQVMSKELSWQSRMALYKKVQLINERIQEIQKED